MILVNTKTIRIVRIPITLPIMATSLQWGTLYRHKEATHTQIVRLVCQLWTSTHYMYVSNRVLKVSNNYWEKGIHVNVYVCNLHCTHCGKKYTITVTYVDYIIVFEVLFCQNFTWGGVYVPLTSLLGSWWELYGGLTEECPNSRQFEDLITGSAPLQGCLRV